MQAQYSQSCFIFFLAFLLSQFVLVNSVWSVDDYVLGPDSKPQAGVPKGRIENYRLENSKIFPGTSRDWAIYIPAKYNAKKPHPVMIFHDGAGNRAMSPKKRYQPTVVMDNLIHKGDIPPMIGIFVSPGDYPALHENAQPRFNRSLEYDGVTDHYARFMLQEIIPQVKAKYNLSEDPNDWGITGASSGGINAFNMAWHRPDKWRRVASFIGTFADYRGAKSYPTMIRKGEPRPLRVMIQGGSNDQHRYSGEWWLLNKDMASALGYVGYELKTIWGDGAHNAKHGSSVLPEVMRWLWLDYPKPVATPYKLSHTINDILLKNEHWQKVLQINHLGAIATNKKGEIIFYDGSTKELKHLNTRNKIKILYENIEKVDALIVDTKDNIYASQQEKQRVIKFDSKGKRSVFVNGFDITDMLPVENGLYLTSANEGKIYFKPDEGNIIVVDALMEQPTGIDRRVDHSHITVFDRRRRFGYIFQPRADGSLINGQYYMHLNVWEDGSLAGGGDSCYDSSGRLFVITEQGLQVVNHHGRAESVLDKPNSEKLKHVVFAGKNHQDLYVSTPTHLFKRRVKTHGIMPWDKPFKPNKNLK